MNEKIEKELKQLTKLVEEEEAFLAKWKSDIDAFFTDDIQTSDTDFKNGFKYLYKKKDLAAEEYDDTEFEKAEKLINASGDEKAAEYMEQLQALRERNRKNIDAYESIRQDIQKKYNAMEAIVSEKIEASLRDFSKRTAINADTAKLFPKIEEALNSIPNYDDKAAYNSKFLDDYAKIKNLKNTFPFFERGGLDYPLEGMIDFLGKEKKAAYKKQLQALWKEYNKVVDPYHQIEKRLDNKYDYLRAANGELSYRFNNIFKASVDRFWTSDRKVDEQKSSDEYKSMRAAVNALVDEDGNAKRLEDPKAQKQLYRAAYDACSRYAEVKKGKFSKLSHNGSERLRAARDMMTAITALYPEFEKSVSKNKNVDPKKQNKVKMNFEELSNKCSRRMNKVYKEELRTAKRWKKGLEM